LYLLQVDSSGASFVGDGNSTFNQGGGEIHSDYGTGLIYSDTGNVGDPTTGMIVGSYSASGLVAPDSSLNLVFILGQTGAQAETSNYTIQSFDQKTFAPVSSITLSNVYGYPVELVRWGSSGLAVLTVNPNFGVYSGPPGMIYLLESSQFVSSAKSAPQLAPAERVQRRWEPLNRATLLNTMKRNAVVNH
jgi:hypothetical protein